MMTPCDSQGMKSFREYYSGDGCSGNAKKGINVTEHLHPHSPSMISVK